MRIVIHVGEHETAATAKELKKEVEKVIKSFSGSHSVQMSYSSDYGEIGHM
jgi:hypothetical protein